MPHNRLQPADGARFDFASPLAKDLIFYIAPLAAGRTVKNWAKETAPDFALSNTTSAVGPNSAGVGINWSGLNNDNNLPLSSLYTNYGNAKNFSVVVLHNKATLVQNSTLYARTDSSHAGPAGVTIFIQDNPGKLIASFNFSATRVTSNSSYALNASKYTLSAVTHADTGEVRLYMDGALDIVGTDSQVWFITGDGGNSHTIGSAGGGGGALGSYIMAAAWNRVITADEVRQLSVNPWLLLKGGFNRQGYNIATIASASGGGSGASLLINKGMDGGMTPSLLGGCNG